MGIGAGGISVNVLAVTVNEGIEQLGVAQDADGHLSFEQPEQSVGKVRSFYGNFLVAVRALTYILTLGREGIPEASSTAVLNANYLAHLLAEAGYDLPYGERCMHEFVIDCGPLKAKTGVSAMDVAKRLLDFGIHPPTMYFPLIVHEALMAEPTETESRETLDEFVGLMTGIVVFESLNRKSSWK